MFSTQRRRHGGGKKQYDLINYLRPPKAHIASLPTPVDELTQYNRQLPATLFVKRDDKTDCLMSGNKIRKLEYFMQVAKRKKVTHVITCGALQSNHCRATALCATRLGLQAHLVLRKPNSGNTELHKAGLDTSSSSSSSSSSSPSTGVSVSGTEEEEKVVVSQEEVDEALKGKDPQEEDTHKDWIDGNFFLMLMVDPEITYVTAEEYQHDRDEIMQALALRYEQQGKSALVIPEGGSGAVGCWGYIDMVQELIGKNGKIPYDHIVVPVGSGGTLAGVLLGCHMLQQDHVSIWGVNVCQTKRYFRNRVDGIVNDFNHHYGTNIDPGVYTIIDGFTGEGYGIPYKEEIDTIKKLARLESILLDPVYGGKAFHALITKINEGEFEHGARILYVYTGGVFGLFAQRDVFALSARETVSASNSRDALGVDSDAHIDISEGGDDDYEDLDQQATGESVSMLKF